MLNIGLIGNTESLEPFVIKAKKNPEVNIIGKTSVGSSPLLDSFHYTIPEFNRLELIERADVFLINELALLPFQSLCSIVRKSKHVFFAEYPELTVEECIQLIKLSNESGSVIQVTNPYFYHPVIRWMSANSGKPIYLDISWFHPDQGKPVVFQMLFMLAGITGISPKKIGAVSFRSEPAVSNFTNVRLEFGDASLVNLNYGHISGLNEFKIKAYSPGKFYSINFHGKSYLCNQETIDISSYGSVNEMDDFFSVIRGKHPAVGNLEDYMIILNVVQKINKKIAQFSA